MKKLVNFDRIIINLIDLKSETMLSKYSYGPNPPGFHPDDNRPLAGSLTHRFTNLELTSTPDARSVEDQGTIEEGYRKLGLRSSTVVLLKSKGVVVGSLAPRSRMENAYGPREQAILERQAAQIAPAVLEPGIKLSWNGWPTR